MAILAAYALASLVFTPLMPLAETYALRGLAARGRVYGPVRLWGSAAFIVGTFVAGIAANTVPAGQLIWLIVTGYAVAALVATMLSPLTTGAPAPVETGMPRRALLRDPAFIAGVAAASLIQSSHAVYYSFSVLQWRDVGFSGTTIAGLWALGVVAEIVLFAAQGRLPLVFTPTVLLMIGGIGAALRWQAMAFNPPAAVLPILQVLHAMSFGATHLGMLGFVAAKALPNRGATAQGYLAVALGTVMAISTSVSGVLFAAFGSLAYEAMTLAAILGTVAGYVAHRTMRNVAP
jgi:PPP family 3-phenylpropionic acid transporter